MEVKLEYFTMVIQRIVCVGEYTTACCLGKKTFRFVSFFWSNGCYNTINSVHIVHTVKFLFRNLGGCWVNCDWRSVCVSGTFDCTHKSVLFAAVEETLRFMWIFFRVFTAKSNLKSFCGLIKSKNKKKTPTLPWVMDTFYILKRLWKGSIVTPGSNFKMTAVKKGLKNNNAQKSENTIVLQHVHAAQHFDF